MPVLGAVYLDGEEPPIWIGWFGSPDGLKGYGYHRLRLVAQLKAVLSYLLFWLGLRDYT